jgi:protein involved in polysaccharide export with SLBB domain
VLINADTRVLDAITTAGGFTVFANKSRVQILRRQPDGNVAHYRFDYGDYVSGNDPASNFLLEVGDTIVVPD